MNREQRRRLLKRLGAINRKFKPGDKVMFDMDKLYADNGFYKMRPEYREFIIEHKDDVFTVEYDPNVNSTTPSIVTFEELKDTKWMFFVGHLKHVRRQNNESH